MSEEKATELYAKLVEDGKKYHFDKFTGILNTLIGEH